MSERPAMFREQDVIAALKSGAAAIHISPDGTVSALAEVPPRKKPIYVLTEKPAVYVVEAPPLPAVKIGFVKSGLTVCDRISTLQTGCPYPIELVAISEGSRYLENLAHWRFAPERMVGEWFERSERVERFIDLLRAGTRLGDALRDKSLD